MDYRSLQKEVYGQYPPSFIISKMPGSPLPYAKIPLPKLKKIAHKIALDVSFSLDNISLAESVDMLQVFVFASLERIPSFQEQLDFLYSHSEQFLSWMVTDGVPQYFKRPTFDEFKPFFLSLLKKKDVFSRRLAYVSAMKFKDDSRHILFFSHLLKDDRYYVYMGEAWLLATLAISDYHNVKNILLSDKISEQLRKKTISKMRDSYRISPIEKEEVRKIRDGDYKKIEK
jgi:3-methyladenine DNA glycosylase AlkD